MCRRIRCATCKKPSYSGCGAHVEQVLADVPAERRCRCREEAAARPRQGLLSHHPLRTFGRLVLVGAVLGLIYQRLVGCSTGTCPITSSPYVSTIYGAALGLILSAGLRGRPPAPEEVETLK